MNSPFSSGRYYNAFPGHKFSSLWLFYSHRYKWLMCFTASAVGGRGLRGRLSSSHSAHVTDDGRDQVSEKRLLRLLIVPWKIELQNNIQLAGNDNTQHKQRRCAVRFLYPPEHLCVFFFTRSFSFNYRSVGRKILIATNQIFTTWVFGWRAYCNYTLTWWRILLTLGEKKSTWMCSSSEERNWKAPCSHTQLTQLCVHKRSQTKTSN